MNVLSLELSLEQQFSFVKYEENVAKLNLHQAQELLLEVLHQLMVKDNAIRSLIRSELELGEGMNFLGRRSGSIDREIDQLY